jgi:hypothetical protein
LLDTGLPNARELGTCLTARIKIDPDGHIMMQQKSSANRTSEALDQDTRPSPRRVDDPPRHRLAIVAPSRVMATGTVSVPFRSLLRPHIWKQAFQVFGNTWTPESARPALVGDRSTDGTGKATSLCAAHRVVRHKEPWMPASRPSSTDQGAAQGRVRASGSGFRDLLWFLGSDCRALAPRRHRHR